MPDIEPIFTEATKFATGVNKSGQAPDRKQVGVTLTNEEFIRLKDEALRQKVSIGAVLRQLIDLL